MLFNGKMERENHFDGKKETKKTTTTSTNGKSSLFKFSSDRSESRESLERSPFDSDADILDNEKLNAKRATRIKQNRKTIALTRRKLRR